MSGDGSAGPHAPETRLLVADAHPIVRDGVRLLCSGQLDLDIVGEAGDGATAVELAERLQPDVLIMDVTLPRMNGLRATRLIRERAPGVKILTLTTRHEETYLRESFRAGATGYALKASSSADVLVAIRTVALGRQYVDPSMRGHMTKAYLQDHGVGTPDLSAREQEVLQLTAWGHRNTEVALRLEISVKTVEAHKANGMRKLGLGNRIDLTRFALLCGWFQEG